MDKIIFRKASGKTLRNVFLTVEEDFFVHSENFTFPLLTFFQKMV